MPPHHGAIRRARSRARTVQPHVAFTSDGASDRMDTVGSMARIPGIRKAAQSDHGTTRPCVCWVVDPADNTTPYGTALGGVARHAAFAGTTPGWGATSLQGFPVAVQTHVDLPRAT
jgi:hypothetical protein